MPSERNLDGTKNNPVKKTVLKMCFVRDPTEICTLCQSGALCNEWAVTLEPADCEYEGRNDSLQTRH